jgi:hypothetical protein
MTQAWLRALLPPPQPPLVMLLHWNKLALEPLRLIVEPFNVSGR